MQDLAHEIACLLEPSKPLGYRLVILGGSDRNYAPFFEARAVRFKGGIGYAVREARTVTYGKPVSPVSEFDSYFAPTSDALKYAIRRSYNRAFSSMLLIISPGVQGYSRSGEGVEEIMTGCGSLNLQPADSFTERALGEAVAALSMMQLPVAFKWE